MWKVFTRLTWASDFLSCKLGPGPTLVRGPFDHRFFSWKLSIRFNLNHMTTDFFFIKNRGTFDREPFDSRFFFKNKGGYLWTWTFEHFLIWKLRTIWPPIFPHENWGVLLTHYHLTADFSSLKLGVRWNSNHLTADFSSSKIWGTFDLQKRRVSLTAPRYHLTDVFSWVLIKTSTFQKVRLKTDHLTIWNFSKKAYFYL
jgi:hypothetical protein